MSLFVSAPNYNNGYGAVFVLVDALNCPEDETRLTNDILTDFTVYVLSPTDGCPSQGTDCYFGASLEYSNSRASFIVSMPYGSSSYVSDQERVISPSNPVSTVGLVFRYSFTSSSTQNYHGMRKGYFVEDKRIIRGGADRIAFCYYSLQEDTFFLGTTFINTNISGTPSSQVSVSFISYSDDDDGSLSYWAYLLFVFAFLILLFFLICCCIIVLGRNRNRALNPDDDNDHGFNQMANIEQEQAARNTPDNEYHFDGDGQRIGTPPHHQQEENHNPNAGGYTVANELTEIDPETLDELIRVCEETGDTEMLRELRLRRDLLGHINNREPDRQYFIHHN